MEHIIKRKENLIKKLVSNSRAIITNQVSIPFGVVRMTNIMSWLGYDKVEIGIDLDIFQRYYSAVHTLALGSERLEYNREFLREQDIILDEVNAKLKDEIIDKCFEIIEKYK